jgi:prepilin-type N-terminal cleavage/methylation domain-containing protein
VLRSMEKKRSGEAGFTLVELLVVIVILGILAAIVVFAVGGVTDKGQSAACKTDRATLEAAEEAYFAQNGSYVDSTTANNGGALVPSFLHQKSTLHEAKVSGNTYLITGLAACSSDNDTTTT